MTAECPTYDGNFAPQLVVMPCPDCNPVEPMPLWAFAGIVGIFAVLIGLLAWFCQ